MRKQWKGVAMALAAVLAVCGCGNSAQGTGNDGGGGKKGENPAQQTQAGTADDLAGGAEKEEPVELTWYIRFDDQQDTKLVNEKLNELLLDKINATVKILNIPGAVYDDKMQVILGGQEECDVIFTGTNYADFWGNVARGAFLPLNDLLEQYAPQTYAAVPEEMWQGVSVDGDIYGVINYQIEGKEACFVMTQELLGSYPFDLDAVETIEDIEPLLEMIHRDNKDIIPFLYLYIDILPLLGYDEIGAAGSPGAIEIGDDGMKVINQYELDSFRELVYTMRDWFEKGYITEDAATMTSYNDLIKAGKVGVFLNNSKPGGLQEGEVLWGKPLVQQTIMEARVLPSALSATVQAISSTSKHPEKAMEFINLLNTDKEVYNLVCFGIEGVHYNKIGDNRIEMVENSGYQPNKAWAMGNQFNAYVYGTQPDDVWEQTIEMNEQAEISPLVGFVFDMESVKSQMAQCQSVYDQYFRSLSYGTVDPDRYLPEFLEKLEAAGSQDIIDEKQRQLDEWLKTKGEP